MKRSIAFLLVVVMCIGMIPASILPALAHGIGVGVDNVENLSIDNAPNQKVPATVTVDAKADDTAWVNDEWQLANQHSAIWTTTTPENPDFSYRYQLHIDYEFVYGIIEIDKTADSLRDGVINNMTVWLNDGSNDAHYTAKIVITPDNADEPTDYSIAIYHYGSTNAVAEDTYAQYQYEYSLVEHAEKDGILTLEFKGLISAILGKKITEKTTVSLSAFLSAEVANKVSVQYLYHPRVDAQKDAKAINLADKWENGAKEITQTMIYDINADPSASDILDVDKVDQITVDGHLEETAWKNFTTYGNTDYETFIDYTRFTEGGHMIANYDVEYSTEYMYHSPDYVSGTDSNGATLYQDRWIHYHEDNVNFVPDKGETGSIIYTPGCFDGHIWSGSAGAVGAQKEHVCTAKCEQNYINNIPVKFKYQLKSDGENIYGAVVVDLSVYNDEFYYTGKRDTFFKVMIAGKANPELSNPWTRFAQLEMKHSLESHNSIHAWNGSQYNKRVITANSEIGKSNQTDNYGNTVLPDGVGAYARRVDANTMVFEFCISYDQVNANLTGSVGDKNYKIKNDDEISVLITVANETSGSSWAGAANNDYSANAAHACSGNWFGHRGEYDALGRENKHRYILGENDGSFSKGSANGTLDAGMFNGLIATDRFVSTGYRNRSNPGAVEYMDYKLFMSTEYLYGAAIVKKNGYEEATATKKSTAFDYNDMLRIWINNGDTQWRDSYDYILNLYLDPDSTSTFSITANKSGYDGNTGYSDYYSNGTYYDGANMEKGQETYFPGVTGGDGISFVRRNLDPEEYDDYYNTSSNYKYATAEGEVVIVEFKVPLELLGISEKVWVKEDGVTPVEMSYYVSAECIGNGTDGIVSPTPNNRHLDEPTIDADKTKDKVLILTFNATDAQKKCGGWITTQYSGVDGSNFIKSDYRTNQFVIDGIIDEMIWNDEEERVWVNSYTGSWGNEPDVPHMFDYQSAVYTGREYIYGAAIISTAAVEDNESLVYTLWINNNGSAGASKKFSIVQKGDHAVCYDLAGNEIELTRKVEIWKTNHEETQMATVTDGKVAMTNANGVTYVEYMFSLEALGITLHEQGEDAYTQYSSKGWDEKNPRLTSGDKFYYYWNGSKFVENKKLGFEYFVSVTKMDTECGHNNTLYYPAPQVEIPTGITEKDKFCHLADDSRYNSLDRWDNENTYKITPLGYFVPETIYIDGDLSDSGWRDDMWIDVVEGVNGNLQNPVSNMDGATIADYKYQVRSDDEYFYVAAVVDVPASPIRYITSNGSIYYSTPRVRLWVQSHDKDFEITVNHNGLKVDGSSQVTYTFDDAVSFTHLYDVTLGNNSDDGSLTNQQLTIDTPAEYNPETYVTWQDKNVPHVTADKLTKLNDSLKPTALTITGSTLRYAVNLTGFFAPFGGNDRRTKDPVGILSYRIGDEGDFVSNIVSTANGNTYPTVHNFYEYDATDFYGTVKVIEENTVTAQGENAYTDKDWYAKPEVKKYVYANEHAIMTSDETGTKTIVEFRVPLKDIGCEDGDEFEYFIQGGTNGVYTDTGYTLFNPPIVYDFTTTTSEDASKLSGRPYWYWGSTGKVVDEEEMRRIKLRNNYEPVTPIGAQYKEGMSWEDYGDDFLGVKFGMLYDADYMRQPRITDEDSVYKNATYWDLKEIGMMIGYTDYLETNVGNLTSDCADDYNIYRIESDTILNHVQNTNMADYESYIFYTTMLLWPGEYDTKLTYRGFVDYYPSDHIYYTLAAKTFSKDYPWTYSTPESDGKYLGKPLTLDGVNGDPTKIPTTYTYRPTFYSDTVTRNINMIRYADDSMKAETSLPEKVEIPTVQEKPNASGQKIFYVPLDDRPINLERVEYQAEAAGFEIVLPPEASYYSTMVDKEQEGKSHQGDTVGLRTWWINNTGGNPLLYDYNYYVLSLDQLLSGGLVGSREPFCDTAHTLANYSSIASYDISNGGYQIVGRENDMITRLKSFISTAKGEMVFIDTVRRLASTGEYYDMSLDDYESYRIYGTFVRPQLYGNELTIENIVKNNNKREDGSEIAMPLSGAPATIKSDLIAQGFNESTDYYFTYYVNSAGEILNNVPAGTSGLTLKYRGLNGTEFKQYLASRERKLLIAEALYPAILANPNCTLYVGYDDSKPFTTIQTNEGRYIEEKLLNGYDNALIFSGTDELGMMSVAKISTDIYGSVSVNAEFFGIGKDEPGDAYDTGTLYKGVMAHINGVGATYAYHNDGEIDVLILTRSDHYDKVGGTTSANYSASDLEQLRIYAGQLIDRVDANLNAGIPTVVVDCAFQDDYLAAMLMQRYGTSYHTADVSGRLNELLSYSQWNTTANSLGTAISNGVSRYTYLKNCDPEGITEQSHIGAYKANVKAWVKDYGYQSKDVVDSRLDRSKPHNGESNFATCYNNFWEATEYIMAKLNMSSVGTSVDASGKLMVPAKNAYKASVSNLWWRWDRAFEANFDISVVPSSEFQKVDYNDYKVVNLALSKPYTATTAPSNSYVDSGEELSDGIRYYQPETGKVSYEHSAWVGYDITTTTLKDAKNRNCLDVVYTLDNMRAYTIYQASVQILNYGDAGIHAPKYIQLYTSMDNENFTLQRTIDTSGLGLGAHMVYLGTDMTSVDAKYVKIRFGKSDKGGWVFASEINILGIDPERAPYYTGSENGLYFKYEFPDNNGTYIRVSDKGTTDTSDDVALMTADNGSRMRWYHNSDTSTYTRNMYDHKALYQNYSLDLMSGWNWVNNKLNIDLTVDSNSDMYITAVGLLIPTDYEGWRLPADFELSYEDENGNFVHLDINVFTIKYIENSLYGTKFDGYNCILELKDELILPSRHKLRITTHRDNMSSAILTGIRLEGRYAGGIIRAIEEEEEDTEEILFDSSYLTGYQDFYLPSYAPFALYDTGVFSDTTITEISFPFGSFASGYTAASTGLTFPVYVIKSDLSSEKADCTLANGKKVIIDLSGKLDGVQQGDWVTVSNLNIKVGPDETLAFGDSTMKVFPMYHRSNGAHGFWNQVFTKKADNPEYSLILKIKGLNKKTPIVPSNDDGVNTISFIGDSISTYTNWSNNTSYNNTIGGNAVWFPNTNYTGANMAVEDTWWYKAADALDYELCVNNSWSGSVVNTATTYNTRSVNIHNTSTGTSPDVVVIFMGINDCAANTAIGTYNGIGTPPSAPATFSEAYGKLIKTVQDTYQGVEIYCCTVLPDEKRSDSDNEEEYNAAIRTIATNMGVNVIDLYANSGITASNISTYTVDDLHPNAAGMQLIANAVVSAING